MHYGKQDRMIEATGLLYKRLKELERMRIKFDSPRIPVYTGIHGYPGFPIADLPDLILYHVFAFSGMGNKRKYARTVFPLVSKRWYKIMRTVPAYIGIPTKLDTYVDFTTEGVSGLIECAENWGYRVLEPGTFIGDLPGHRIIFHSGLRFISRERMLQCEK